MQQVSFSDGEYMITLLTWEARQLELPMDGTTTKSVERQYVADELHSKCT